MFDQFKFTQQIRMEELGHIESPLFAHHALDRLANDPARGRSALQHLYQEYRQHQPGHTSQHQDLLPRLHQAIDAGGLVYLCKRPLQPVMCWQPDTSAPQGGHWQYSDRKNQRLHALDQHIRHAQAKASQRQSPNNRPAQTAPATPPPARILNHANVKPQPQAATTTAALRLSNAVWSQTRVPVGDSVHACFTAHDAPGGESVNVTIYETNADGSQTEIDQLTTTLEAGTQRYNLEWSRSAEAAEHDLEQDEEENDSGPVSYVFEVQAGESKTSADKPLNLSHSVRVAVQTEDEERLPEGADIILIAADGRRHQGELQEGVMCYKDVILGPFRFEY